MYYKVQIIKGASDLIINFQRGTVLGTRNWKTVGLRLGPVGLGPGGWSRRRAIADRVNDLLIHHAGSS